MGDAPCHSGGDVEDGTWTDIPSCARLQGEQFYGEARRGAVFSHRTE
jgi:hypothetical protein